MPGLHGIGRIDQIAYVVPEIEAAVDQWMNQFGAGPFFLLDSIEFPDWTYCGEPQALRIDLAVGQLEHQQIEFIRPHSDKPSVYSHAIGDRPILHHFGVLVDELASATARIGDPPALATALSALGTPFSYLDTRRDYGVVLELIEKGKDVRAMFELVAEAAQGWDGSEPLRSMPSI